MINQYRIALPFLLVIFNVSLLMAGEPGTKESPATEQKVPPPLYLRAGGASSIAAIGEEFAAQLVKSEALNSNAKLKEALGSVSKPALRFQTVALLCQFTGGPERYSGPSLYDIFKRFTPGDTEWSAVETALKASLASVKSPDDLNKEWLAILPELRKTLETALASEPVEYESADRSFAISFPKNWDRKEGVAGSTVIAFAPPKEGEKVQPNVAVVVEELPVEATAAEYAKASALSGKRFVDFKAVELGPFKVGSVEGHRLTYTHKMGGTTLQVIALHIVQNKRAYVINCTSEAAQTAARQSAFEAICRTFRLIAPAQNPVAPGTGKP